MRNKKIEKTHAKEKQSHTQDNIYVIRQFAYVNGVVGISLLLGKNTKCSSTVFLSLKKLQPQILITKNCVFYIPRTGFTMGYKTSQKIFPGALPSNPPRGLSISAKTWACWPKPQLHGLSLRKSPIKNHVTLFRVGSSRQPDQT